MYFLILGLILYSYFIASTCHYTRDEFLTEEQGNLKSEKGLKPFIQKLVLDSECRLSDALQAKNNVNELKILKQDIMDELNSKLSDFSVSLKADLKREINELRQSLSYTFDRNLYNTISGVLNGNEESGDVGFIGKLTSSIKEDLQGAIIEDLRKSMNDEFKRILKEETRKGMNSEVIHAIGEELRNILEEDFNCISNLELVEVAKNELNLQIKLENYNTTKKLEEVINENFQKLNSNFERQIAASKIPINQNPLPTSDKKLMNQILGILLASNQADQRYLAHIIIKMIEQDTAKETTPDYNYLLNLAGSSNNPYCTGN